MNKKRIIGSIIIPITALAFSNAKINAQGDYNYDVGHAVNLVTNQITGFSIIEDYMVFDTEKLYNNISVNRNTDDKYVAEVTNETTSINEFTRAYSTSCGVSGTYADYTFKIGLSSSLNYEQYVNKYAYESYYSTKDLNIDYTESLINLPSDSTMYSYYNSAFVESVNNAINSGNDEDYYSLFDRYGTHFFTKCSYGTNIESNTYCYSSSSEVISQFNSTIATNAKGVTNSASLNTAVHNSLSSVTSFVETQTNSSCFKTEGLISTEYNNYMPIWEYFDSGTKSKLSNAFSNYVIYKCSEAGSSLMSYDDSYFNDENTITDSGIAKNVKNYIQLNSSYIDKYSKIVVKLDFVAKQIDKGYSWVYLFGGTSNGYNKDNQLAQSSDLDLTKGNGWEKISISFTFNVNKLNADCFWICYDASGSHDDDWKRKELYVSIKYCS